MQFPMTDSEETEQNRVRSRVSPNIVNSHQRNVLPETMSHGEDPVDPPANPKSYGRYEPRNGGIINLPEKNSIHGGWLDHIKPFLFPSFLS